MGLLEDLRQLSEQVRKRATLVKGEEGAKQSLVLPFFQVLGYDIYDPSEVQPEYTADFAKRKANGQMEKIDYALHVGGQVAIFVECKAAGTSLEEHDAQLARYFNSTPSVKVAVLTNGVRYRFFTDLQAPNMLDANPFFEFDVTQLSERDAEMLRLFTRDNYAASAVQGHAEEVIFTNKVMGLVGGLLRDPSENFVRFLLGELDLVSGRVTARVVERFIPIVRKAVQVTLLDMMTKSLQQEIAAPSPPPAPAPPPEPPPAATRSATDSTEPAIREGVRVETTAEELEIFQIVSRICGESAIKQPLSYKDTVTYFGINLGKVSRWFLRVFVNGARKHVVARVPFEQASMLARGFECEALPDARTRVFFNSASDFDKLRSLVLVAYEEETKRKGDAADDGA